MMRSLKKMVFLILVIFSTHLFAAVDKISVEISTDKATLDEQVTLIVKVESDAEAEPVLSGDPANATILTSEYQGASTSTIYMNGELSTKREYIFAVVLKPNSLGRSGLTNIKAEIGGRVITHNSVWFNVVEEKAELPEIFLLAQPSKTQVYENEPILVRYYLMSQFDLASLDIKEFPKLNNFVKRYLQESGNPERVAYEGRQYVRKLLYSLVLFPEKAKLLKIDPMRVAVTYDAQSRRDPFGFGSGRLTSKTLSSKTIDIEVLKLPVDKMPTGFTGLVGQHKFELTMNKTKVLVNEPIEIKLKIKGNGNLEGADTPNIINEPSVESFEANSSFEILDVHNASKTFEYTYLARKEINLPPQKIPLSFFNPETRQFETIEVDFPGLQVVGGINDIQLNQGAELNKSQAATQITSQENSSLNKNVILEVVKYSGPYFNKKNTSKNIFNILNIIIFLGIILLIGRMFYEQKSNFPWLKPSLYREKLKLIAENGPSYAALEDLMLTYPRIEENISLKNKIAILNIPLKSKQNLEKLIENLDSTYSNQDKITNSKSEKNYWKMYKNDLCLLVQELEAWDKNKNEHENN